MVLHFHTSIIGGHSGIQATLNRIEAFFYWKGMRKMVKETMRTCDVCQRNKANLFAYPVTYPYTAKTIAQLFLDHIHRLHGLPKTIVSDRDRVFMSLFWQSLFKMLQVQLKMSIAYHPQIDAQTELKKCLSTTTTMEVFPECDAQGLLVAEPIKFLERKKVKQQNRMGVIELIQWGNELEDDATWEDLADLVKRFPTFILDP
ncbi:retrotransposon-related protein [Tanacetum coccineum]